MFYTAESARTIDLDLAVEQLNASGTTIAHISLLIAPFTKN